MGWKSIDDGVGGHEGPRLTRRGLRGFRSALGGGGALLAALTALLVTPLFAASPAEARWNVDPCLDLSQYPPPAGERTLCSHVLEMKRWQINTVPTGPGQLPEIKCDRSEKLAGTNSSGALAATAHWDFWSLRGEWVTWTGGGHWSVRDGFVQSFSPTIQNWWTDPYPVRVFLNCDAKPSSRDPLTTTGSAGQAGSPTWHANETAETGDSGDDAIDGDGGADALFGKGGGDELRGARGDDELFGGSGDDATNGGRGDDYQLAGSGGDTSRGGGGDDQLLGGTGDDTAFGGRGSDELFDNEGRDELHGGRGDDRFSAHDRSADTIRCGKGEDIVVADRRDRVAKDCEHVYRTKDEAPNRPPRI